MHSSTEAPLRRTVEFWNRKAQRELTLEEGRQAVENISGFFTLLADWDAAQRRASARSTPTAEPEAA